MLSKNRIAHHRHKAFLDQSGKCYYCNAHMWEGDPSEFMATHQCSSKQAKPFQCTAGHLVAKKDGGKDTAANIVAACRWCNQKRHKRNTARSAIEHKQHVDKRLREGRWLPFRKPNSMQSMR